MWVTWKELTVPSYLLVEKLGPIPRLELIQINQHITLHLSKIWGPSLRLLREQIENRLVMTLYKMLWLNDCSYDFMMGIWIQFFPDFASIVTSFKKNIY